MKNAKPLIANVYANQNISVFYFLNEEEINWFFYLIFNEKD